jgi:hypothetical protein
MNLKIPYRVISISLGCITLVLIILLMVDGIHFNWTTDNTRVFIWGILDAFCLSFLALRFCKTEDMRRDGWLGAACGVKCGLAVVNLASFNFQLLSFRTYPLIIYTLSLELTSLLIFIVFLIHECYLRMQRENSLPFSSIPLSDAT